MRPSTRKSNLKHFAESTETQNLQLTRESQNDVLRILSATYWSTIVFYRDSVQITGVAFGQSFDTFVRNFT